MLKGGGTDWEKPQAELGLEDLSVLPALGRLSQKHHDFEANLSDTERPYLKEQIELGMDVRGGFTWHA